MEREEFLRALPIIKQIEELARTAYVSKLTNLLNGAALDAVAARYFHLGSPLAVVFIDLAGFKRINDLHGHDAGDFALSQAGAELLALATDAVFPFHKSGDEFVVLVKPEVLDDFLARSTDRLLKQDIRCVFGDKEITGLRATIGYAVLQGSPSLDDLLKKAEAAMRTAKIERAAEPRRWSEEIGDHPIDDPRRKCDACGATTSLQVLSKRKSTTALSKCANCDRPFDPAPVA